MTALAYLGAQAKLGILGGGPNYSGTFRSRAVRPLTSWSALGRWDVATPMNRMIGSGLI